MKRALVIEDNKSIADLIKKTLGMSGIMVEIASNGNEGIIKYNDENFDLVITDINMPEIGGEEVCDHIRESNRPATPIIGITGTVGILPKNRFDEVIHKPFSLKILTNRVQNLLQEKKE